jgi:protein-disulfide isomerase
VKSLLALLFVVAVISTAVPAQAQTNAPPAQGPAKGKSAQTNAHDQLPTENEVLAAIKRNFGYDPRTTARVIFIRPSALPGIADVVVSINNQPAQHIYVSADGKRALLGEMVPWGANPFQPARARLAGAQGIDRGPANAATTLYVFTDLQCADCKTSQPVLDKLVIDFPQMRQVFLPVPLPVHAWSMTAAKYADCLGRTDKTAFWPYINAVFKSQGVIATDATSQLKSMIPQADAAKVDACIGDANTEKRIFSSIDLSQAIELDVDELPTVFLNGRKILNPASIPYEKLKSLVQFEQSNAGK